MIAISQEKKKQKTHHYKIILFLGEFKTFNIYQQICAIGFFEITISSKAQLFMRQIQNNLTQVKIRIFERQYYLTFLKSKEFNCCIYYFCDSNKPLV